MGHDATRIARAHEVRRGLIQRLIRGASRTVTLALYLHACQLWDTWWDKTPPGHTLAQRRTAARARHQARLHDWPAAAGLEEDILDNPGYRPACHYRPATGIGNAPDFHLYKDQPQETREIA